MASLPDGLFNSTVNLFLLNVAYNRIVSLRSDIFDTLHKLAVIDLRGKNFFLFPGYLFYSQVNLNFLNLAKNKIQGLPNYIFSTLNKLTRLYLGSKTMNYK